MNKINLALLRISMGLIFIWSFFDKLLGLGFSTLPKDAWIKGTSATSGFLIYGTEGPLQKTFAGLSGQPIIDWIFMMGLFCIGTALLLGIGMRIVAYSGSLLMILLWLALFPPEHHPLLDEHIIYLLVLLLLWDQKTGQMFGLGNWWKQQTVVKRYKWLE